MNQEYMKTKPVLPLVISMALPMTVSMLVNALYNIVDSYFVAKISENAMTALSLVYPLQNITVAVAVGFGIGTNAIISICLGAKKHELADSSATMGLLLAIIHGIILTAVCLVVVPSFLKRYTDSAEVIGMGLQYSNIVFLFVVPNSIAISFEKIFQSVGKMKVSMICMMIGCIVNIILDPVFIFGIGPFAAMGIKGAAIATGIGQAVTMAGYIIIYILRPIPVKIRLKHFKPDLDSCRKIYSVGLPATLNLALPSLQISALNAILSAYRGGYVLVLGAYYKLQTFLYLTANGVVQGMRPIIGYNYGANEMKRVKKIFNSALSLIAGVMVIGTVLCLLIPENLIGIFTDNIETIEIGRDALRIISIGFIISSVTVTVSGAFEGLGKGVESLVISLMRYIAVMLPLAFVLSRFIGAAGVWHSFWITEIITAVAAYAVYKATMKRMSRAKAEEKFRDSSTNAES